MRPLDPVALTEVMAAETTAGLMAEIDFPGGTERVFQGWGTITWAGQTWSGTGDLVAVGGVSDTATGRTGGLQLILADVGETGPDMSALINKVRAGGWQGSELRLYYGFLNPAGTALLTAPVLLTRQLLDTPDIEWSARGPSLIVNCLPLGFDRDRAVQRMLTPADQRAEFSEDSGLDRAPLVGVQPIVLGASPSSGGGQGSGQSAEYIRGAYNGR